MSAGSTHDARGTGDAKPSPKARRRPPNPREQARRNAKVAELAEIGREWKRKQLAREGKL